jgi:hypothetical protein
MLSSSRRGCTRICTTQMHEPWITAAGPRCTVVELWVHVCDGGHPPVWKSPGEGLSVFVAANQPWPARDRG